LNQTPLRLQAIDFERSGRDLVVSLTASHPFEYQLGSSSDHKLRMLFPGLHVPPRLVKLYRLGKFDSAVRSALLTDTPDGAELILSGIQDPVPVRRQGPRMHLHIPARTAAAAAPSGPDRSLRQPETKASSLTGPDREDSRKRVQLFPGMKEEYTGSPISLDLQDADIEHVLRLISEVAGYDLILDQEVSGTISLKLDSVPWDQALDLVLMQKSLGMVQQGNILRVAPVQTLQKEQEQILKARRSSLQAQKSKQDLAPLHTEYIQINYAKSPDLQKSVQKFLSDRGEISHDAKTNQLIVSDTAQAIDKVRSVVRKLDRAERQVLIEARLVYATDEFQRSMGIKWGGGQSSTHSGGKYVSGIYGSQGGTEPIADPDFSGYAVNLPIQGASTFGLGAFFSKITGNEMYTLDAKLDLGESQGQVNTISSPRVVTLNNQLAEITQGTKIATKNESESGGTTTEYVDATLKLAVTPQITPDNTLILELDISDDSPVTGGEDIETRSLQTRLFVDNDQTVVIGGVQQLNQSNVQDRVPGLARIPLLGWLFKNEYKTRTKRELLIFIRPHILQS
jgi:type IV pilus assembly protein PilQ